MRQYIKPARSESEILSGICDYLKGKGYFFWRQNNVGIWDKAGKGYRRMPKGSIKGVPDLFLLDGVITMALEIKAEKGVQSPDQKKFQEKWTNKPFRLYSVIRSVDDLICMGL